MNHFKEFIPKAFPDGSDLSFADIARRSSGGIIFCDSEAQAFGGVARHVVVVDTWRRLVFLGGGEVSEVWLAGLLEYDGTDLRGDALDVRLRTLRILKLHSARLLKERSTPAVADDHATRKPSKWQRKQFKKRMHAESAGSDAAGPAASEEPRASA